MLGQRIKEIVTLSLVLVAFLPIDLQAVVGFSDGCTKQFVGEVTKVTDSRAPLNHLEKVKVSFNVLSTSRNGEEEIETLKYGPHQFKVGDTYEIAMREKWICSVKKID